MTDCLWSQVLSDCELEEVAAGLALREWEAFQAAYSKRLRRELGWSPRNGQQETAAGAIAAVRRECLCRLLPVDMGSGVVEEVWRKIKTDGDWGPFDGLVEALQAHEASRRGDSA